MSFYRSLAGASALLLAAVGPASSAAFTLTYSGWLIGSGGYQPGTYNSGYAGQSTTVSSTSSPITFTDKFPPSPTGTTRTFTDPGDQFGLTGGTLSTFSGPTAFSVSGFFDTNQTNQVAALGRAGFAAYKMSNVRFTIAGVTYTADPSMNLAAAIFDKCSGFGPTGNIPNCSGNYGLGVLHNGTQDTGFSISEFTNVSTAFTIGSITDTVASGYDGGGFGNRAASASANSGLGANVPDDILLLDSNNTSYTLRNYFYIGAPLVDANGNVLSFSAELVPEPASFAVVGLGLAGLAFMRRRRAA